jgi:hypothetical protein
MSSVADRWHSTCSFLKVQHRVWFSGDHTRNIYNLRQEKEQQMKNVALAFCIGVIAWFSSGCGVYMAFTQPPRIDTASLEAGEALSRDMIIEKLGAPRSSIRNADGTREDIYEFYEGSKSGWKILRGVFHLGADIFTFGAWEIVATPSEYLIRGDRITAEATFDNNDRLTSFRVVGREEKPLEKIHKKQNGS